MQERKKGSFIKKCYFRCFNFWQRGWKGCYISLEIYSFRTCQISLFINSLLTRQGNCFFDIFLMCWQINVFNTYNLFIYKIRIPRKKKLNPINSLGNSFGRDYAICINNLRKHHRSTRTKYMYMSNNNNHLVVQSE